MRTFHFGKTAALAACTVLVAPVMVACGGPAQNTSGANLPPIDASQGSRAQNFPAQNNNNQNRGMGTGTKVAILAGAAALYYMYNKNKQKRAQGDTSQPQYYLSKNGRVYYRNNTGQAVWVTPPQAGIQVPYQEAQQYSGFQGYDNRQDGRSLADLYKSGGF
ncbi:hypothetical protein EON81_22640 [bacterium]|nr:MAG: hypothetical protein EON81_22640 [bacterium]